MKKLLFLSLLIFGSYQSASAQKIATNALGLRFSNQNGLGTEMSFQRKLSTDNRIEVDLGWRSSDKNNVLKLSGIYQWIFDLDNNFQWFTGAGTGIGNSSFENESSTFAVASGNIGIEYIFDFPLQASLDYRPEIVFGSQKNGFRTDIALSLRYVF